MFIYISEEGKTGKVRVRRRRKIWKPEKRSQINKYQEFQYFYH